MFYGDGPQPSLILTKGFITTCPSLKRFSVPELKEHSDNLSPLEHNISRWGGSQNAKSATWQRTALLGKPAAFQGSAGRVSPEGVSSTGQRNCSQQNTPDKRRHLNKHLRNE